jgi:Na+/melibiose symporter-like transporter
VLRLSGQQTNTRFKERRYVGNGEAASYVFFDASESINAGIFGRRYNLDILKINLNLFTVINLINGIWDVVNDTFTGPIVDKTRTRWGKFKPYLIAFAVPSLLLSLLTWTMPYFLNINNEYDPTKFFLYLAMNMIGEAMATFRDISKTGLLSTMTPNPSERVRLLSMAKFISSQFDQFPTVALSILYDMMNNGLLKISSKRFFYGTIGISTALISTTMAMVFFFKAKERVVQSEKPPNLMEGFKTIVQNRPVFLLMLNDLLNAFRLSTEKSNYYIDVLGYNTFGTLVEIPALPFLEFSYTRINHMRKKYSSKTLWLLSTNIDNLTNLVTFALGCIGGTGKRGWYRSWKKMLMIMIPLDIMRKSVWGTRNVVPQVITYEAIDYCEWKNGYRSEGVIIVMKGLMSKIVGNLTSGLQTSIMSKIGYSLREGFGKQSDGAKFGLFITGFLLPGLTGALSIIPKLLYNLSEEEKDKMYRELHDRRLLIEEMKTESLSEAAQDENTGI